MVRSSSLIAATLVMLCGIPANAAGLHFKPWDFIAGKGSRGTPFCGILSAVDNKEIGQNIVVKGGAGGLVVDLYKDKWIRPQGGKVRVAFDFIDNQPLVLTAYADAHILDVEIPQEDTASFLLEIAERPALRVIFPDDDKEATWVVLDRNARAAILKMTSCMTKLVKGRP
ncbi:MAG TPA: hypothetical protein VHZ78_03000 [Rhizomicrobium sp.]|jgi:hypothetical protein|nr:hypothetical protein [Rhizomicrobium sp.]